MLSKRVGEHHAKHHHLDKREAETSTLFEVKLALLTITKGETLHSQIHNKTELLENCRNWQWYIDKDQQGGLGYVNVQRDHSYSIVLESRQSFH